MRGKAKEGGAQGDLINVLNVAVEEDHAGDHHRAGTRERGRHDAARCAAEYRRNPIPSNSASARAE